MSNEVKQLVLQDICTRLLYGLHVRIYNHWTDSFEDETLSIDNIGEILQHFPIEDIKPYLRPMSSITEEETKIINNITNKGKGFEEDEDGWIRCDSIHTKWGVWPDGCAKLLDYLNSIHVDYRGLIPMGLALEAPVDMYEF